MSIDAEFLALMPDTLTIYVQSSVDKYGKRTFSGSGTSVTCRVQYDIQQSTGTDGQGEARTSKPQGRAFCYGDIAVTTDHRLVLPGSIEAIVRSVNRARDESGAHHTVIHFGEA
jgi:hypothetical protein